VQLLTWCVLKDLSYHGGITQILNESTFFFRFNLFDICMQFI
jgi:hypothetical protein